MSLINSLLKCFEDEPNRIFAIQELCLAVQKYYTFSDFQKEPDPKHPQLRYEHEVRSQIAKLKKQRLITRLDRNKYKLI